jgi:hypothetical protein
MTDSQFDYAFEADEWVPCVVFPVKIARQRPDRWRAETDMERTGERGLSGVVAAHGDTRDEAVDLPKAKVIAVMTVWGIGPHGRRCLVGFRCSDEPDSCPRRV